MSGVTPTFLQLSFERGRLLRQLCLLLLMSCSCLLVMQRPACAAAEQAAVQSESAASAAAAAAGATSAAVEQAALQGGTTAVEAAAAAAAAAQQALSSLRRVPLAGDPSVLARGFGAVQDATTWGTLATKLSQPGARIQIAVFGTSITQGFHKSKGFAETWAHEVPRWLQKAFPSADVELINLARDASDVTPAAVCWYQRVPATTDLIIIDYALGGCTNLQCTGIGSQQVADFESLLRRLMRRAPGAAFLLLETFNFKTLPGTRQQPPKPMPYYLTGGDMQWVLARRYRIPMVSMRDALYDLMYDDNKLKAALGVTRAQMMADSIHPNARGHHIIGHGLIAFALKSMLQQELARTAADGGASAAVQVRLPSPVSPLAALEADGDTFCAEGRDLDGVVDQSTVRANNWTWTNTALGSERDKLDCVRAAAARGDSVNCGNWGLSTAGFGRYLDFEIDTKNIPGDSSAQLGQRQLLLIYDRAMAEGAKVGTSNKPPTALVQCVSGCTCNAFELGGDDLTYSELTASGKSEVSAHRRCIVRLSTLAKGAGSNDYFKVNGIAVVPYAQPARLNWVESAVIAREQLFNDAYRVALVPKASAMGVEHDEAPVQQSFSRRPYVAGASGPGY